MWRALFLLRFRVFLILARLLADAAQINHLSELSGFGTDFISGPNDLSAEYP